MRVAALILLLAGVAWADPGDAPAIAPDTDAPAAKGPVASPDPDDAPTPDEGPRPATLADDTDAQHALAAYNAGRYNEAARRFLGLVQRWPREAPLYRALARARVWAGDADGAVRAYRLYLEVNPEASDRDKIEAEMTLAQRKANNATGAASAESNAILGATVVRAKSGKFLGEDGALAAIDKALELGYIGPRIAQAREAVSAALVEKSGDAIDRWWRPAARVEPSTLRDLAGTWDAIARRRALTPGEATFPPALLGLLALAEDRGADAAKHLEAVAPSDFRLRYAQALAFLQMGRTAEAGAMLEALARMDEDPRILILWGLVQRDQGNPDAIETLRAGLLRGD